MTNREHFFDSSASQSDATIINENALHIADDDDSTTSLRWRQSRILPRKSHITQTTDTQKIRQDLNDLRERLQGVNPVTRENDDSSFDEACPHETLIGDLRVIFVSDAETRYINTSKQSHSSMEDSQSVKVKVDYKTFEIHKSLLAESSEYFRRVFNDNPNETFITLDETLSVNGFVQILDFLYDAVAFITPRIGEVVLDTAAALGISWITEAASHYMLCHIDSNNYLSVLELLKKYSMNAEREDVFAIVARNLVDFCDNPKFIRSLTYDLLAKILSENYYVEASEGFVVKVILDWIEVDMSREEHMLSLIDLIRFPLLEPEELLSLPEAVKKLPGVQKKLDMAMEYACDIASQCLYITDEYLSRGYRDLITFMSATDSSNGSVVLYKDKKSFQGAMCLENIKPRGLDTKLFYTSQATLGNYIYAVGGLNEDYSISRRIFRYDPRMRDWQELANMITPRANSALASSGKRLFAVGGQTDTDDGRMQALDSAEMYDPRVNAWTTIPPLPVKSFECASVFCNGMLYVSGGRASETKSSISNLFFACNVNGDGLWSRLPDMPVPRFDHAMLALYERFYLFGGKFRTDDGAFDDCLRVDVYNTETCEWDTLPPLPSNIGTVNKFMAVVDNSAVFLSNSKWHLYDLETGETIHGEYCGTDVTRVACLKVAHPPVNFL